MIVRSNFNQKLCILGTLARFRILIESAGGRDLVPCVCSEEPVGDWLTDLQERLYWNVSKTANSINPLLHNKLQDDPCSLSVEQQLNGHSHSRYRLIFFIE